MLHVRVVLSGLRRARVLAVASAATVACSGDTAVGTEVASLEVSPPALDLKTGETRALTATVLTASGAVIAGRGVYWSSQGPAIATVSSSGIVTAVSPGNTLIAASSGGRSVVVPVTVSALPVTLVRVSPASTEITVGSSVSLIAEGFDAAGGLVIGRPATWSSSNVAVATVTGSGAVTGVGAGNAAIAATVDGIVGTALVTVRSAPVATVTVSPAAGTVLVGAALQLTATARDEHGVALAGRFVAWSSSAPAIASVSSTGLVTALSAGATTIAATVEGKVGTSSITAALVPVFEVRVTPPNASLAVGASAPLIAQVMDSAGQPLNGRSVTWSSDLPGIATVSTSGVVTAVSVGQATITATSEGKSGQGTVTVTSVPVASLTVTPSTVSLLVGATQQVTAIARDAQGNTLPGRLVTWASGAPSVATVDQAGVVSAVGAGTVIIIATCEGQRAQVSVTVTPNTVASVAVSPPSAALGAGATLQLTATIRDAQGNALPGKVASWTTSATSVASVSSTGLVTGVTTGSATITATSDRISGTSAITVSGTPVATVTVAPNPAQVVEGGTVQLVATPLDSLGSVVGGASLAWSSAAPVIATISTTGLLTGVAAGTTSVTVSASSPGQVAPASVTVPVAVAPAPAASVTASSAPGPIHIGTLYARTASAQVLDAGGSQMSVPVIWTSSAPAALAVTSTGGASATLTAIGVPTAGIRVIVATTVAPAVADTIVVDTDLVPVAAVGIAPGSASLVVQQKQAFTATASDSAGNTIDSSNGNPLGSRTFAWGVSGSLASVSPASGLSTTLTALQAGTGAVSATIGAAVGRATISIVAAPVDTIVAATQPPVISISAGTTKAQHERFRVYDTNGKAVPGLAFTVSSSDPAIAAAVAAGGGTTDSKGEGQFAVTLTRTAKKGDAATIIVSAGGKSSAWSLVVK